MEKDKALLPTFSGLTIDILNPNEKDISYKDISHSLSNICRFGGQCKFHYSVGFHTLLGLKNIDDLDIAKEWFLHDAAEAYIGDVIRPVKILISQFKEIEMRLLYVIYKKYNINFTCINKEVIDVDNRMLLTEASQLYNKSGYELVIKNYKIFDIELYKNIHIKEFETRFVEYALDDLFEILILKGNLKDAKDYVKTLRV